MQTKEDMAMQQTKIIIFIIAIVLGLAGCGSMGVGQVRPSPSWTRSINQEHPDYIFIVGRCISMPSAEDAKQCASDDAQQQLQSTYDVSGGIIRDVYIKEGYNFVQKQGKVVLGKEYTAWLLLVYPRKRLKDAAHRAEVNRNTNSSQLSEKVPHTYNPNPVVDNELKNDSAIEASDESDLLSAQSVEIIPAESSIKRTIAFGSILSGLALTAGAGALYINGFIKGGDAYKKYTYARDPDEVAKLWGEVETGNHYLWAGHAVLGAAVVSFGISLYCFLTRYSMSQVTRVSSKRTMNWIVGFSGSNLFVGGHF